jgi:hypothetical protein
MHREYSRAKEGLVSVIIDSYDKAKLSLPRFPFGRVPKKSIYEETRRAWASSSFLLNFKLWQKFYLCCCLFYHMVYFCCFEVFFEKKTRYLPDVNGSYLPWLGLLHVSFFRSTERRIKLELGVCSSPLFECFGMSMRWIRFFWKVFVLWQLSKNKRYYGLWTLSMPELWSWISHSPVSSLVEI